MNTKKSALRIAALHLASSMQRTALRVRQLAVLMGKGSHFGVLSAYRPGSKSTSKKSHTALIVDLQALGYRKWEPLRGKWEGVAERSILVPNMKPQDLFYLGRKYEQDAVIYKSSKGVLGMYYLDKKTAVVAVDPEGTPLYEASVDSESTLFSKARGLRFEFGFVWTELSWDGRTPLTPQDVMQASADA